MELEGVQVQERTFLEDAGAVDLENTRIVLVFLVVAHVRRSMPQAELHIMYRSEGY